jgi:photosystem II stability/assembly factor-like uncharacterized protein
MKRTYIKIILPVFAIGITLIALTFRNVNQGIGNTTGDGQQTGKKKKFAKYDKADQFSKYFRDITTQIGKEKSDYQMNYQFQELQKAISHFNRLKRVKSDLAWVERGPANVGGRTRALVIDPDDAGGNTWYVGAASGGIWKTTDAGDSWVNLSDQFSNLSVNAMAMAQSNRNVIYAGTGESFPGGTYLYGNGIWKSTDKGISWVQLANTSTSADFAYINRIIVDPLNENIVLAATETGIFKSIDGGANWTKVYASKKGVEDLVADPADFTALYAGENGLGVLRSNNAGNTWEWSSNGLGGGSRFEIAVSPVNSNYLYVSANVSTTVSNVYISQDKGLNWKKFNDSQAFLSSQGNYDNTIAAHPYNANEVFVGGVDMWKLKFDGTTTQSEPTVKAAYTIDSDFLIFINFGGSFLDGGMSNTDGTNLLSTDWTSVEIRFGPGLTQKAHRFTVPDGATSGVPATSFTYVNYVDVPFQVWDITSNRQLMVSFRDQEKDGAFNLYERTGEAYGQLGREYIYVNAVPYNATTPAPDIAKNGGHLYKSLYMFWPNLAPGYAWNQANLPVSKIVVDYGRFQLYNGTKTIVADSYNNFNGPNRYNQGAGFGTTAIPGLHPDHHNIKFIPKGGGNFYMINANDGGLAISTDNAASFSMKINKYITTQFYGVAKNPQANEYFGGMQDNGSWQSPAGVNASNTTHYLFRLGGDGFECLWNAKNQNLLLGSVYNNSISRSINRGASWVSATSGIIQDDGPFITRLSASRDNPDLVFAVGKNGVYRSTNFGLSWTSIPITTNWLSGTEVSSSHNVEVSLANGNIAWAGAGMATSSGIQIQVSTNEGLSFSPVSDYSLVSMNAYTSGISTHPIEDSTAYVLFSLKGKPKVLRTRNLGQSWEDISGFGTNNVSSNGFPDVVVHSLVVMPHDPKTIWVGTDIGLFESNDDGLSWHIANNGLPPVSVYDMLIVGNQVVLATHGRGIWSVDIPEIDKSPYITEFKHTGEFNLKLFTNFKVSYDSVRVFLNGSYNKTLVTPGTGSQEIQVTADKGGIYTSYLIGYLDQETYKSNTIDMIFTPVSNEIVKKEQGINIFPNPGNGNFKVRFEKSTGDIYVQVHSLNGMLLYFNKYNAAGEIDIDLRKLPKGTYLMRFKMQGMIETRKVVIN